MADGDPTQNTNTQRGRTAKKVTVSQFFHSDIGTPHKVSKSTKTLLISLPFQPLLFKMFNTAAQSITKKAPQQAARIQRAITSDAFAFHPVRKTRYDQVIPTAMFQRSTQQQVARINTSAAQAESHSFGFYPVQRNRVRTVTPKSQRECYGYYPANVVEKQSLQTATISDAKAVRAALREQKQSTKYVKTNWDSVLKEMKSVKKATSA